MSKSNKITVNVNGGAAATPLSEARISKAQQDSIQAIHDHAVTAGAECAPGENKEELEARRAAPWLREARLKALKQNDSMDKHVDAVRQAVRAKYQDSPSYAYPRDVFDNHVVVQHGDKLFAHPYEKNDDGNVTLGDPTQVEATYQPMKEADFLETASNGQAYLMIERQFDKNVGGGVDRDKLKDSDFAGKNRSYPIVNAKDVKDALHSIGRAGAGNYSAAELKKRILAIAKRKGLAVPESDADEAAMIGASLELAGDLVPLVEGAVRKDGTIPLKIIQPGWGSSGYYPAEVLERDGPKVFVKGTQMFLDHPTPTEESDRPERSIKDLAAVLTADARWMESGPAGRGLYGDASVMEQFRPFINEAAPHIGVSIRAMGAAESGQAEGRKGVIIKSLAAAKSIDFVTQAGAGGKVLPLYEAARRHVSGDRQIPTPGANQMQVEEKELQALRESAAEVDRLREAIILREAKDHVATQLAKLELPELTVTRLIESLAKNPPVTGQGKERKIDVTAFDTKIVEAVKAELAYLKSMGIGDGQVRGMGSKGGGTEADVKASKDSIAASFKRMGLKESTAKIAVEGRTH